ncbi:hypothetical protein [Polaromonas sp.]|uniref:hypothetical protein n=1 Tax=Polaromonas sp. TaxID=1869339 RepID=UPI003751AECB
MDKQESKERAAETTSRATPANSPHPFGPRDAALIIRHVKAARAVLRTVALAVAAQIDGSVEYENNDTERWQPAIDAACAKLMVVRDVLMETGGAPPTDWLTPLGLLEAIGAALWHGNSCAPSEALDMVELVTVAQVAIDLLDSMIQSFEGEAVGHA